MTEDALAERRIALVTGANKGIGLAIARRLARQGLVVLLGARDPGRGRQAASQLREDGLQAQELDLDVSDSASVAAAVAEVEKRHGRLDILVNNAGISREWSETVLETPVEVYRETFETNAYGPLRLMQRALPLMRQRGYGRIVNVSTGWGALAELVDASSTVGGDNAPAYRLSKTLLNGLTILFARQTQGTDILVNAVCPGWVRTDLGGPEAPLEPDDAIDTAIWLATLPPGGPNGGFFRDRVAIAW